MSNAAPRASRSIQKTPKTAVDDRRHGVARYEAVGYDEPFTRQHLIRAPLLDPAAASQEEVVDRRSSIGGN